MSFDTCVSGACSICSSSCRRRPCCWPVSSCRWRASRFASIVTVAAARALEQRLHEPLPGLESRFAVTLVISNIENCSSEHGENQLDIRYRTLTSHLPTVSGVTIESRDAQRRDPAAAAGAVASMARVKVAPAAAYNASDGFQAGGTLSLRQPARAIDSVDAQAIASTRSHLVRAAMSGTRAPHLKGLDTGNWQMSFSDEARAGSLDQRFGTNAVKGQFIGQTVPLGSRGVLFRFGGSFEGGHQQARVTSDAAAGTAIIDDRHGYAALRAAGGITAGGRHYSAAASYGVLLGHERGEAAIGYRKHIADLAWDSELPIADHRALRIEGRLNAGWLLGADAAPLSERFRGGNREESFLEGSSWMIRSNPLLRSVPSNQLDRTSPDAALGGDRFVAMNVTLSAPLWRYPLIPVWLSRSNGFTSGIEAAKETGRNQAIVYYQSQDPAQKLMEADAARVTSVLDTLFDGLSAVQSRVDADHRDTFDDCLDAADTARDKMKHLKETGFGPVATNVVPGVFSACVAELAAALPPDALSARLDELKTLGASIADKQKLVRTDVAQSKADADLKFAFTAMDTFINDVNAVAIGPVVALDAARLGPQLGSDAGGMRYGIGIGARLSIVNVLHLTALYAWNPSPRPWESRGAWLMSLTLTDLLR